MDRTLSHKVLLLLVFGGISTFGFLLIASTNQDDFVRAYFLVRDAEDAERIKNYPEVNSRASEALTILQNLAEKSPDWDPKLVSYYISQCRAMLANSRSNFAPSGPEPLARPAEKLVPPAPVLRETSPIASTELEQRMASIEEEIQKRKEAYLQRLQGIVEENKKLKDQAENAQKELASTRELLSKLQSEKKISQDLIKSFQSDLQKVAGRIEEMDSITEQRFDSLSRENESLRARELEKERELSKAQAMLEMKERESREGQVGKNSPENPDRTSNDSRFDSLEAENQLLKQILVTIKDQLDKARNNMVPAMEATSSVSKDLPIVGTIALVKPSENYLVVHLRNSNQIPLHAEFGVYRRGVYVGTIRIVEPVKLPFASATVLTGKPQLNDTVR